jgi:hypothetical protein
MKVDAHGLAAEELRCFHPFLVVLDRRQPRLLIRVRKRPFIIHHDEMVHDAGILAPFQQLSQVSGILAGLLEVHLLPAEEPIHVFHRRDPEVLPGLCGEIQVVQLAGVEGPVQGPLGQGDFNARAGWSHGRQGRGQEQRSSA